MCRSKVSNDDHVSAGVPSPAVAVGGRTPQAVRVPLDAYRLQVSVDAADRCEDSISDRVRLHRPRQPCGRWWCLGLIIVAAC
jgi:hypothetical protein